MIEPPSTPIFTASDNSAEPAKASPPMNRLMVTPMPQQSHAMELGHGGPVRLVGIPEPHGRPSHPEHADLIADDQPKGDTQGARVRPEPMYPTWRRKRRRWRSRRSALPVPNPGMDCMFKGVRRGMRVVRAFWRQTQRDRQRQGNAGQSPLFSGQLAGQ
jgi:hypothetical protein